MALTNWTKITETTVSYISPTLPTSSWIQDTSGLDGFCLWYGPPPDCLDAWFTENLDWACTEDLGKAMILAFDRVLNTEEMSDTCDIFTSPNLPSTAWVDVSGT